MLISEVIEKIKEYHLGYGKIDDNMTRDKVLYGDITKECKGIVVTCWPSVNVIRKAHELGVNLIICHEALFWNHGDHTEWLQKDRNKIFLLKKQLLDEYGITVWRNHDYIHSGIPLGKNKYIDGIFYGFAKKLGWENYISEKDGFLWTFDLPKQSVREIADQFINKFNLNGAKILGNPDTIVSKTNICAHILGENNDIISKVDSENIELLIALELIDFTVSEYIIDAAQLNQNKAILTVGHFNTEEPGMEYMLEYLDEILGVNDIKKYYVQSGDMYHYYVK